jgi:hypothetical protein
MRLALFTIRTITVEQDFYASIYLSNMASIVKPDANQEVDQINDGKDLTLISIKKTTIMKMNILKY